MLAPSAPRAAKIAPISSENGSPSMTVIVAAIMVVLVVLVGPLETVLEAPGTEPPLESPADTEEDPPIGRTDEDEAPIATDLEEEPLFVTDRATPNV